MLLARTIQLHAVDRSVNVGHQVLNLWTDLGILYRPHCSANLSNPDRNPDTRLLCVIWDALEEYQLHRNMQHNEPEVLTSFTILVAVKYQDQEVAAWVGRGQNSTGSPPAPLASFALKIRSAADTLALELSSHAGEWKPTFVSLFARAANGAIIRSLPRCFTGSALLPPNRIVLDGGIRGPMCCEVGTSRW